MRLLNSPYMKAILLFIAVLAWVILIVAVQLLFKYGLN